MTKQKKILSLATAITVVSLSIASMSVSATNDTDNHDDCVDNYTAALIEQGMITDESVSMFNEYISTLDDETAELILSDKELVCSMKMANYWAPQAEELSVDSARAAKSLPLSNYPAGSYYTYNGKACSDNHKYCTYELSNNSYSSERCYNTQTGSSGNCKRYSPTGSIQCKAFADYVFKEYNGVNCSSSNCNNASLATVTSNSIEKYVEDYLKVGSHLRVYLKNSSGKKTYPHSIIITKITSSGIEYYQANADGVCGVSTDTKTWDQLASWFYSVTNSWTV